MTVVVCVKFVLAKQSNPCMDKLATSIVGRYMVEMTSSFQARCTYIPT